MQSFMDFENGVIVKIYKVDPILVGGRLCLPKTKIGISSGPMTTSNSNSHIAELSSNWQVQLQLN